ncbi:precorrin-3B C(17)-methyltransferase [Nocardia alni]|uniref:precorrin-3B C(17)-methyltransferase n=1 Tax=Nocardia alni TaxID=2815723 RepID=UPI0020B39965|nr:precorrin-3B C(17)-methyltransferase [Nocardia alni]
MPSPGHQPEFPPGQAVGVMPATLAHPGSDRAPKTVHHSSEAAREPIPDAPRVLPGKLWGIGLGPGDPELVTVKAARIIGEADVIAFHSARHGRSISRGIAARYMRPGQLEEHLVYPVTTETTDHPGGYQGAIDEFYERAAATLAAHLAAGRTVALLAAGDPLFYSSYMHMHRRLAGRFDAEIIPGITSVSAASAALGTPLVEGDQVLTVLPGTLPAEELTRHLATADAAAIMKLGRTYPGVRQALSDAGRLDDAYYVERASTGRQKVLHAADAADADVPYFAITIVPGPPVTTEIPLTPATSDTNQTQAAATQPNTAVTVTPPTTAEPRTPATQPTVDAASTSLSDTEQVQTSPAQPHAAVAVRPPTAVESHTTVRRGTTDATSLSARPEQSALHTDSAPTETPGDQPSESSAPSGNRYRTTIAVPPLPETESRTPATQPSTVDAASAPVSDTEQVLTSPAQPRSAVAVRPLTAAPTTATQPSTVDAASLSARPEQSALHTDSAPTETPGDQPGGNSVPSGDRYRTTNTQRLDSAAELSGPQGVSPSCGEVIVVGLGPGSAEWTTPEVTRALAEATDIVGYTTYINRIPVRAGQRRHASDNRVESERAAMALDLAKGGATVVVVSSGDPGVFAMAAAVIEESADPQWREVPVRVLPGMTAAAAVASRVGAPLGHDFAMISLSDRLKPWQTVVQRISAVAAADMAIAVYNPASSQRTWQVAALRDLVLEHRKPDTPVVLGRDVGGPTESVRVITLADLDPTEVDMRTLLIIGASTTTTFDTPSGARVYTARRYAAP